MLSREDNNRKGKFADPELNSKKYTYLNDENLNHHEMERKTIILSTISEEAISEEKGSLSNRSEINTDREKIQKNLSERCIIQKNNNEWLPLNEIPIKSARSSENTPQNCENKMKTSGFERKTNLRSIDTETGRIFDHIEQKIPSSTLLSYTLGCQQCSFYSHRIYELQSSYELLLEAKNEEVEECKIIIYGLEEKLIAIEKRSQQELEKNKKMRTQFERRNFDEVHQREKENEMMEYLKNREIVMMEQIKDLENQIFISKIRSSKSKTIKSEKYLSKKSSSQSNPLNEGNYPVYLTMEHQEQEKLKDTHSEHSVSEYSANTYKEEIHEAIERKNRSILEKIEDDAVFNTLKKVNKSELVEKVPLTEILIKNNEIESLKDDLLVSQLKTKLEQTKNLQNLFLIR